MIRVPNATNAVEVEVVNDYLDFLDNGYKVRVAHFDNSLWFISLIHRWNGNTIVMRYKGGKATIEKNRKVVKKIPTNF